MGKYTLAELAAMADLDIYNPQAAKLDENETEEENAPPPSVHSLADSPEQGEAIINIPLPEMHPFHMHPFQIRHDEEFDALCESIAESGILTPIIARTIPTGYEIVSGHRRIEAAKTLGLSHVPVIVREMSDEEAVILMVDCNIQREDILPSEKAWAYKMKLDAIRRKAGRPAKNNSRQLGENLSNENDDEFNCTQIGYNFLDENDDELNSRQVVGNLESADIVGKDAGESGRQVQRYIRLTELIPPFLDMVDDKRIAFNPAVELSYLSKSSQNLLHDYIQKTGRRLLMSAAESIRSADMEDKLDYEFLDKLFESSKPSQGKIQINSNKIYKIVPPGMKKKELEGLILELLKTHFQTEGATE